MVEDGTGSVKSETGQKPKKGGALTILVLNGSPRQNGTVATLLKSVVEGMPADRETGWIDLYDQRIAPCIGCMKCRPDGDCVLPEDDGHRLGRMIRASDGLVVGTPTHWGNMSAPLKLLFDRNVPAFMGESPRGMPVPRRKGKPAVIVTACTAPWPFNILSPESRGAIRAVRSVLGAGGYKIVAKLVKPGTRKDPAIPEKLLAAARAAGTRF